MIGKVELIDLIQNAFAGTHYPGDAFLQGSFDGCEPYDEVGAFLGKADWTKLDAKMLDAHYSALSFFSEGGFRFFLPAYLLADLREELLTADVLFHLCHGFVAISSEVPVGSVTFRRELSGKTLLNPRRYGAMTWNDYARYRLSVFPREEAKAIVAYMMYRRECDTIGREWSRIDAALNQFWLDRAENAPAQAALATHLVIEEKLAAAIKTVRELQQ